MAVELAARWGDRERSHAQGPTAERSHPQRPTAERSYAQGPTHKGPTRRYHLQISRMAERLLIVANRLPVTASVVKDALRLTRASSILATSLHNWRSDQNPLWIGWPGDVSALDANKRAELELRLAERRITPVYFSRAEVERYYQGFSNRVLWPLFHYLVDRVPLDASGWEAYRAANARFADVIAAVHQPGDAVWVHDYQLMLLPALIRERIPDAQIGFFLHIPFPSSEVFRVLPWRHDLLRGVLGADLIGFQTFSYLRHFVASLLHVEGLESDVTVVQHGMRRIRLGVYPMGVDVAAIQAVAEDPKVVADSVAIRADADGRRILLGVDRLDSTKGIPRRLEALERLLESDPSLANEIRYIQIAVPSRAGAEPYQGVRRHVEEAVGRINGAHATVGSTPIHYLHRTVSQRELVALYRAADVMVVTPLRDGMNLVAKEFVASRVDADGVLVLSEFAGSASELGEAVVVNPYDVDAVADALRHALLMNRAERRTRMQNLRRRVAEQNLHNWADRFTSDLRGAAAAQPPARATREELSRIIDAIRTGPLTVLLDYDGTLVPIARAPDLAAPDQDLLTLLQALAVRPRTEIHLVSGRPREVFDDWFGQLPVTLWAEHGFWHRPGPAGDWTSMPQAASDGLRRIYPILEQFTTVTPGSLIEEKSASIAWHYRMAEPEFGTRQAHELRMLLGEALSNQPLEVLEGKKVIEVRLAGVSKALVSQRVIAGHDPAAAVVAIGDDRTDEDLFDALPQTAITIAVGTGQTQGRYYVDDHRAVRDLLSRFLLADSSLRGA